MKLLSVKTWNCILVVPSFSAAEGMPTHCRLIKHTKQLLNDAYMIVKCRCNVCSKVSRATMHTNSRTRRKQQLKEQRKDKP